MAGGRGLSAGVLALLQADARRRKLAVEITTAGGALRYCTGSEPVTISGNVYALRMLVPPNVAVQEPGKSRITLVVDDADHVLAVESAANRLSGRAVLLTMLQLATDNTWTTIYSGTWAIDDIDGAGSQCRLTLVGSSTLKQRPILMEGTRECPYRQFKGALCGYAGAETECDRTLARCTVLANQDRFGGDSYALEPGQSIQFETTYVTFGAAHSDGSDTPPLPPPDPAAPRPWWWRYKGPLRDVPIADTPVGGGGGGGTTGGATS